MNAVKLIGNVGRDVSVKTFDKLKMATFSLATNETYHKKNSEQVTNTTWHNVVAWGKMADVCEKMISKGKLVVIEGRLNSRTYINKENKKVNVTEVVALKVEEAEKNN